MYIKTYTPSPQVTLLQGDGSAECFHPAAQADSMSDAYVDIYIYICMYVYIYIYIHINLHILKRLLIPLGDIAPRRRLGRTLPSCSAGRVHIRRRGRRHGDAQGIAQRQHRSRRRERAQLFVRRLRTRVHRCRRCSARAVRTPLRRAGWLEQRTEQERREQERRK